MKKTAKILAVLLTLCMLAAFLPMVSLAEEAKPWAVYDDGLLTFCVGVTNGPGIERANGTIVSGAVYPIEKIGSIAVGDDDDIFGINCAEMSWYNVHSDVTRVEILDPMPLTDNGWFCKFYNLTEIDGLEKLDVSEQNDFAGMFYGCSSLRSLDLSGWDTASLDELGLRGMFAKCSALETLNVSGWNISNVEKAFLMFYGCSSLRELDLSSWDPQLLRDMSMMFTGCSSLETLDFSGWNAPNVASLYQTFSGCSSLTALDLSGFDMRGIPADEEFLTYEAFRYCSALSSLTISENFRFLSTYAALPEAPHENGYSGYWVKEGGTHYTADALMQLTDPSEFAGTWTWETGTPVTITGAKVTVDTSDCTNGTIRPAVTVTINEAALTEGTDYTVDYTFDPETKKGTVTVTGIGAFTDEVSVTFKIAEAEPTLDPGTDPGSNTNPGQDPDPEPQPQSFLEIIRALFRKLVEFFKSIC